jgi:hypothetical protein
VKTKAAVMKAIYQPPPRCSVPEDLRTLAVVLEPLAAFEGEKLASDDPDRRRCAAPDEHHTHQF